MHWVKRGGRVLFEEIVKEWPEREDEDGLKDF